MRLEAVDFHELVARLSQRNHQILAEMARRVTGLQQASIAAPIMSVTVLGRRDDFGRLRSARLSRAQSDSAFAGSTPATRRQSEAAGRAARAVARRQLSGVLFADRSYLIKPAYPELAQRLGLQTAPRKTTYDVAIVGAGPRACLRPYTARLRGCKPCSSSCRAARRPGRHVIAYSKTISAFRRASRGDDLASACLPSGESDSAAEGHRYATKPDQHRSRATDSGPQRAADRARLRQPRANPKAIVLATGRDVGGGLPFPAPMRCSAGGRLS